MSRIGEREKILRLLTIEPTDLALWTRLCRKAARELYVAHPDYPRLTEMQFLSFVKRLLPEIRALVSGIDRGRDDLSVV